MFELMGPLTTRAAVRRTHTLMLCDGVADLGSRMTRLRRGCYPCVTRRQQAATQRRQNSRFIRNFGADDPA